MAKQRSNQKTHDGAEAKNGDATEQKNFYQLFVVHALSNSWVQGIGLLFLATLIALIVALIMGSGIKAAAISFAVTGTVACWTATLVIIRATSLAPKPKIVYFGGLNPGNVASEPLPPNMPSNATQLLLGDDLRILFRYSRGSHPLIAFKGKPLLTIKIDKHGRLLLTATVADSSNRWICRIIDNEFQISQERAFNPKLINDHTLIVRDENGVDVLNVQFQNPRQIRITGLFHVPGYSEPIQILSDEGLIAPNGGGIGHAAIDMTANKNANVGVVNIE